MTVSPTAQVMGCGQAVSVIATAILRDLVDDPQVACLFLLLVLVLLLVLLLLLLLLLLLVSSPLLSSSSLLSSLPLSSLPTLSSLLSPLSSTLPSVRHPPHRRSGGQPTGTTCIVHAANIDIKHDGLSHLVPAGTAPCDGDIQHATGPPQTPLKNVAT